MRPSERVAFIHGRCLSPDVIPTLIPVLCSSFSRSPLCPDRHRPSRFSRNILRPHTGCPQRPQESPMLLLRRRLRRCEATTNQRSRPERRAMTLGMRPLSRGRCPRLARRRQVVGFVLHLPRSPRGTELPEQRMLCCVRVPCPAMRAGSGGRGITAAEVAACGCPLAFANNSRPQDAELAAGVCVRVGTCARDVSDLFLWRHVPPLTAVKIQSSPCHRSHRSNLLEDRFFSERSVLRGINVHNNLLNRW